MITPPEHTPLKMKAKDPEDFKVISTFLQDALVPINGLTHHQANQTFAFLAFRYVWENALEDALKNQHERVHAGVIFSPITRVEHLGFDQEHHKPHALNLLSVASHTDHIHLTFSGKAEIKLYGADIQAHLADMEDPWPATGQPLHTP